ncbi:DoxX family protein [Gluconacetobacter diazotrophicus PA1 5]|uniref:DoxX family protein n=2 Tax=Gluconacetobacter diazotrophicus TaxID=33996 RepID=A0A7W4FEP2_GLUDI|nr:DoxX family protein [Gluconacetobacter diazotrophicus]ACI52633.1 DoxX family protein [Gluconacetobacter diazotrophicus PA1 5]MBB2156386.1 DoxX family protein [Gluconacetobacter diazotrophicus]TWB06040.1 putative oxidoreductase [Gluconacetobacter diazotrophicus]
MNQFPSRDIALLAARFALSLLFLVMGWGKLSDYAGTVAYMTQTGAPLPGVSAIIAILAELGIGVALVAGILVTPLSIALAIYTVVTAFIGHHFWTMDGMLRYDMTIHFYKNISIAGGLLALAAAGPGRFTLRLSRREAVTAA